jgi:hypothetical protein
MLGAGISHLSLQATWEAKIDRIVVPGPPGQTLKLPSQQKKLSKVASACHPETAASLK